MTHPLVKFEVAHTRAKLDAWPQLVMDVRRGELADYRPSFKVSYEYTLKACIATKFVANELELGKAIDDSRSALVRGFYSEIYAIANRLGNAIHHGTQDEAKVIHKKLLQAIDPINFEVVQRF